MAKEKKPALRYDDADEEAYELLRSVIDERFPEIRDCPCQDGFRVALRMADNGGLVFESALKEHGHGVPSLIKKSKPEERTAGGPDVYILIDLNRWQERGENGRKAILAHELCRVEFKRDKEGGLNLDPYERPVVKLTPGDWVLTGFRQVVEWYGEDAVEYQAIQKVVTLIRDLQLGLPFMGAEAASGPGRELGSSVVFEADDFPRVAEVGKSIRKAALAAETNDAASAAV
jgi:hypothetical protein